MKSVTYVLGAGFSVHAGLPLISNFSEYLEKFGPEITRRYSSTLFDEFKRVILNGQNIEESFDVLEAKGILADLDLLKNAVHSVIVAGCERFLRCEDNGIVKPYANFLQLVENQNASLITLNYDTILEVTDYIGTLEDDDFRGIRKPFYAFDYGVENWESHKSIIDCSTDSRIKFKTHTIPFIKLHGGLNFFHCPDHKWAFYADMTNNSYSHKCSVKGCERNVNPGIVPPRRVKDINEFRGLWEKAKAILEQSEVITLVGLNLNERDTDFNNLIKESLKEKKELVFINFSSTPYEEQSINQVYDMIYQRLDYQIDKESIFLHGFAKWIEQFNN